MGTKNNPKNRGTSEKKKVWNDKEVEPIMIIDTERGEKFLAVKIAKSSELVLGENGNPLKWDSITSK
ncbi:MAG: hypothetical protein LBS34_01285 [Rickettsiales bacterium]|jgi:hypothetical protein|nr:hypothetical protein [Rickettsiales bacterium]